MKKQTAHQEATLLNLRYKLLLFRCNSRFHAVDFPFHELEGGLFLLQFPAELRSYTARRAVLQW